MPLLEDLQQAQHIAQHINEHPALNDQQRLFLTHIARTAERLVDLLAPMPASELAYATLLPRLVPQLLEPLAVIYGYTRLLIDQPASFSGAHLPAEHVPDAEKLFTLGRNIAHHLEALPTASMQARAEARQAPCVPVDIAETLRVALPIWRYELRDTQASLDFIATPDLPHALAQVYHLREFVRHIIVTIAREIAPDARITLNIRYENEHILMIFACPDVLFDNDVMYTLFLHQGRAIFQQQWSRMGGIMVASQMPSTLILSLPTA